MRALAQGVGSRRPLLLYLGTGVRFPHLHNVAPLVFRAPTGPAAREARASLRSAPRLEARPCPPDPPAPSTRVARGVLIGVCVVSKPGQALSLRNSARNSPASASNIEFMSLELQRFWAISKSDRGKLCAKCVWGGLGVASRSPARPRRRLAAPSAPTGTAAWPVGTAAWPVGTAISHAIPQQLIQTLNLHRWNCNVFWVC